MSLLVLSLAGISLAFLGLVLLSKLNSSSQTVTPSERIALMTDAKTFPSEEKFDPEACATTPEQQIQNEVNRRLDALQGHRAMFLAQDRNSDGLVDENEWAAARATIETEVRAEFAGTDGTVGASPNAKPQSRPDDPPPGTDGTW